MQDKIQEIMGLVDKALNCAKLNAHYNARKDEENASCYAYELISEYRAIESKLRELVREPLQVKYPSGYENSFARVAYDAGWHAAERAHGITSASD